MLRRRTPATRGGTPLPAEPDSTDPAFAPHTGRAGSYIVLVEAQGPAQIADPGMIVGGAFVLARPGTVLEELSAPHVGHGAVR